MSSRRNESARARRRQKLKEQLSLTSVPRSEIGSEGGVPRQHYTLDNHFGWKVLYKTQMGDGTFPYLTQYYEKPDISGRDFQKVTYVLYMEKGSVIDKDTALKQTQTAVSGVLVQRSEASRGRPEKSQTRIENDVERKISEIKRSDKKPRKLISEFYYIPRDRSRSVKRVKSKEKYKAGDSDVEYDLKKKTPYSSKSQLSEIEHVLDLDDERDKLEKDIEREKHDAMDYAGKEIEKEKERVKGKAKKEVEQRRRRKPDRWNLRAGAENCESNNAMVEGKVSGVVKTESKLINKFRFDPMRCRSEAPSEHLLQSKSGTNKYLYLSRDRRQNNDQ